MGLKVVALAGGTGSAKLLGGLARIPGELTVVANVGDNFWAYGALVCPDLDISCYTLAGIADSAKGWGVAGDTFGVMERLAELGVETWFRLGDRDLATCLLRTGLVRAGATLGEATERVAASLGVVPAVVPVTDDPVETRVVTPQGDLHLQEFWVRERGRPEVRRVWYSGAEVAKLSRNAEEAIAGADRVVLCPANPVSSIGAMLAVPGLRGALAKAARVVALSPMEGEGPFSGPAGKMMKANGMKAGSVGVAEAYSDFLDALAISEADASQAEGVEAAGVKCALSDARIASKEDALRLARELVAL